MMKTKFLIVIFICLSQVVVSQNCEAISPYTEGMRLEYTNYNKKGKVKSVDNYVVKSVTTINGELIIEIESTQKNNKNKESVARKDILKCVDGNFYVDMAGYLAHQNDDQKSNLQVRAEGDFVEFPDNLSEGLELKDATIELKIGSDDSASSASFADMKVYNRKVIQNASFQNKAGTFDAYKMTFDYIFTLGFIKVRGSGIEWYVKGIGIVKTESYSKKGKLRWTRELTKITK
ncbi:TapB family protein [Flavivirga algicola]|uniref:DUF3108 domain-containing protein n=1 Tax=Flavivirga algicola TaxID=2729136 RepID=A0ABX1RVH1_9FLAO|nr:hypothetical protein [Flavivirga algicola]NMH87555.1 hypothetical protein [Flavivirga algicola]